MVKKITAVAAACLLLLCSSLSISAAVEYTKEPTGGKTVYVAGNPDMYPIEYYDSDSKTYKGILPDLYKEISESTGLDFTYIRSGSKNEQNRLAKNRQAEIISAHIKGEIEELYKALGIEGEREKLEKLEKQSMEPDFYNDIEASQKVLQQIKQCKVAIEGFENLKILTGCFISPSSFELSTKSKSP